MKDQTFRALVNDRAFDVVVKDDDLLLDDASVSVAFDAVGDEYFSLLMNGTSVPVVIESVTEDTVEVTIGGRSTVVRVQDEHDLLLEEYGLDEAGGAAEREIRAPMPGLVLSVMVEDGQAVSEGDGLVVLEAMKMENELRAPADGVVKTVHVAPQDAVDKDALLIEMEANPDA
jgi:pyruvate carboxylase subunit B